MPRRLHLWWDTDTPPDWVLANLATAIDVHPEWTVRLWTNEPELQPALEQAARKPVTAADRVRHQSNVIRWHLLRDLGGVWIDTDVTCLRPLDELLVGGYPFCASLNGPEPTVIGGPAHHRVWDHLIAGVRAAPTSVEACGQALLARVAQRHRLRVLPPAAFFDLTSQGRPVAPSRNIRPFTRHEWRTSSQRNTGRQPE